MKRLLEGIPESRQRDTIYTFLTSGPLTSLFYTILHVKLVYSFSAGICRLSSTRCRSGEVLARDIGRKVWPAHAVLGIIRLRHVELGFV